LYVVWDVAHCGSFLPGILSLPFCLRINWYYLHFVGACKYLCVGNSDNISFQKYGRKKRTSLKTMRFFGKTMRFFQLNTLFKHNLIHDLFDLKTYSFDDIANENLIRRTEIVISYTYLIYSFDKFFSNYTSLFQSLECVKKFLSTYLYVTNVSKKFIFIFIENLKIVIKLTHKCVWLLCHANSKNRIGFRH